MPTPQVNALRARFGLSAADVAPIVFTRTPSGKVWGGVDGLGCYVDGLGRKISPPSPEQAAVAEQHANARAAFLDWLAAAYPEAVAAMIEGLDVAALERMNGLGADEEPGFMEKLFGLATTVLPTYLQYQQQKDVLDIQIKRAEQGLPPLETAQYAPSVQIGLDQETVQRLANEATARAQSMAGAFASSPMLPMLLLGGGVLAFMMMSKKKRGRR